MDMYLETSPTASNNQDTSSWYSHCGDNRMACREKLFYSVFLLQHSHRIRKIKMKEAFLSVVYYFSVYQMFLEWPLNDEINFMVKIVIYSWRTRVSVDTRTQSWCSDHPPVAGRTCQFGAVQPRAAGGTTFGNISGILSRWWKFVRVNSSSVRTTVVIADNLFEFCR